ncbi:DMT family transporter [Candidatus Woesearchaeota archaeon]|nr:DMT family transporter [Candidatus Woesearchaeota archaeon]
MTTPWYMLALLSALCIAAMTVLNKKTLRREHTLEFCASRGLVKLIMGGVLIIILELSIKWLDLLIIYGVSVLATIGIRNLMKATKHMDVSITAPLSNLSPLLLLVIAYFVLGESPTLNQLAGILLIIAGAYVLQVDRVSHDLLEPLKHFAKNHYMHLLIGSMIVFSITATLDRWILSHKLDAITYMVWLWVLVGVNFIIIESHKHGFMEIIYDLRRDWKTLVPLGALTFLANFFYLNAAAVQNIAVVIGLKRSQSLFVTLTAGLFFRETHILSKSIASLIMIGGIFLMII